MRASPRSYLSRSPSFFADRPAPTLPLHSDAPRQPARNSKNERDRMSLLPTWREVPAHPGKVVAPDERLPWPQTIALGVQHVVAMFGATVLAPLLMGFDPNVAILFSGIGTLIFFVAVGGHVPSYLGSSFAFIAVVIAATGYAGSGPNANIGVALGGIVVAARVYALIGLVVMAVGTRWIEALMPPVVTGAVVAVIGLNLAGIPVKNMAPTDFDTWMQARHLRLASASSPCAPAACCSAC